MRRMRNISQHCIVDILIFILLFTTVTQAFATPLEVPLDNENNENRASIQTKLKNNDIQVNENNNESLQTTTQDSVKIDVPKQAPLEEINEMLEPKQSIQIPENAIQNEIVVKYKNKIFGIQANSIDMNVNEAKELDNDTILYSFEDTTQASEVVQQLMGNPLVEYVEYNMKYEVFNIAQSINDEYYSQQWGLESANVPPVWTEDLSTGEVTVAVIDTGVDSTHPDLIGRVLDDQGRNFAKKKSDGTLYPTDRDAGDDNGHGTQVTGIINAVFNNGIGITGLVGPANIKVLPIKVMNERGIGSTYDIAEGIRYAVDQGVDIINLSLGGKHSQVVYDAVTYALENDVLVVAAAGNSATSVEQYYPAAIPGVLTVGAVTKPVGKEKRADFSNYGNALDIVAPGEQILTTTISGTLGNSESGYYKEVKGTSFAAPFVSAAAALYKLRNPNKNATDIFYSIISSAEDLGEEGKDSLYGYGKLNVANLIGETVVVEKPTITFSYPTANTYLSGTANISVQLFDDAIDQVTYFVNEKTATNRISISTKETKFETSWDTNSLIDGQYNLIAVAYDGDVEKGIATVPVWIQNNPQSGLMLKVINPEGNPTPGAEIHIFRKAKVVSETHIEQGITEAYDLVWEGYTDTSGTARVPSTDIDDLETLYVLAQGSFDHKDAESGKALFFYHRTIEGPGYYTVDGTQAVQVKLSTTDINGDALTNMQYFVSWLDEENRSIGITTPISDEEMNVPLVYMDKGQYNLFAYKNQGDQTYFLGKWQQSINQPKQLKFDGQTAGEVELVFDQSQAEIVDGTLYFYNDETDEALGIGNVLTGKVVYVTPGEYDFWADIEVKDPNEGDNWIYSLGSELWNPKLITVQANQKVQIKMGGKVQLQYFEPDVEKLKEQSKKMGIPYIEEKNPYEIEKSMRFFYTKQKFVDAHGNMLYGMYRGSLSGANLIMKQNVLSEQPNIQEFYNENGDWKNSEFYFGNIFPYFKVTKTNGDPSEKPIYNNTFQMFYYTAFWFIDRDQVPTGDYDLQLSLEENPLAGTKISKTIVNTVKDSRSYSTVEVLIDGERIRPNQVSIYTVKNLDSEDRSWELVTTGSIITSKNSPDYGLVKYPTSAQLSNIKNGNLYRVIYIRPDGEYVIAIGQFTTMDEIKQIHLNSLHRVEFKAFDENGQPLQAKSRERSIIFPSVVDGKKINYIQITGKGYSKDAIWLPKGTYHFDGNYITLPDNQNRTTNYYLLKPNITIAENATNIITFDARENAKVSLAPITTDYDNFKGAILLPYNQYRNEFKEEDMVGHDFYIPSNLEIDLYAYVAFSDKENNDFIWSYFLKNPEKQIFTAKETVKWNVAGQFKANLKINNKNLIATNKTISGQSGITDEFNNELVTMFVEDNSRWKTLETKVEKLLKLQSNRIKIHFTPSDWTVDHDFSDPELEVDEGQYPHLRVYKKLTSNQESRIFNDSKIEYFTSFNETIESISTGDYRVELAYDAGPNGPITASDTFSIANQSDSSSSSGGGSSTSTEKVTNLVKQSDWKDALQQSNQSQNIIALNVENFEKIILLASQVKEIQQLDKSLQLTMKNSKFFIPSQVIQQDLPKEIEEIEFISIPIDTNEANSYLNQAVNSSTIKLAGDIYELSIQAINKDGNVENIYSFSEPVQVSLPVLEKYREVALSGELRAHRYNPETKAWEDLGGTYNSETNMFTFETMHFSKYALMQVENEIMNIFEFTDLDGHWAKDDIQFMHEKGYVSGVEQTHFMPDKPITRAEFTALITRVFGLSNNDKESHFKDVSEKHWAFADIHAALEAGIVAGYNDNSFKPNNKITREEMVVMIVRALKASKMTNEMTQVDTDRVLAEYEDNETISEWARDDIAFAIENHIVKGSSETKLNPLSNASRAEAVVLLKRIL